MRRHSIWILSIFLFSLLRFPFFVEPSQSAEAYLSPDELCGEVNGFSQYTTNPSMGGVPDSGRMDFERALWSETVSAWSPTNLVYTTYSPGVTGAAIAPTSRLCFNPQGDVYNEQAWAWNSNAGWIDFDWCDEFSDPTSCASMVPSMDLEMTVPTSGPQSNRNAYWGGYAWSDNIGWIQFDWTCSGCDLTQRVHTQLPNGWPDNMVFAPHANMNGEVDGYAWNDSIGWINFGHTTGGTLTQELPFEETLNVLPEVTLTPDPVDVTKYGLGGGLEPVLADGSDAYVLSVKLFDVDSGTYLDNAYDVDVTVTPTTDSFVATNQVDTDSNNSSAPPRLRKRNPTAPAVSESLWILYDAEWQARELDAVFVDDPVYNSTTQAFEVSIKSWAPTSNMNGADDNGDGVIDRYFDEDLTTGLPSSDENKWAIESVVVTVNSGPQSVALNTGAAPLWSLDAASPGQPVDLKFAPPVEVTNMAYVDVYDHDNDGDSTDLLSYIPSPTPIAAPSTLSMPFEGLVALWSNVLRTLPGGGLQFGLSTNLEVLDTDPQPFPLVWDFTFENNIPASASLASLDIIGGFSSFSLAAILPVYSWYGTTGVTPFYSTLLTSIMSIVGLNNFNGSANSVMTNYANRSGQYVPPLSSSVDFEPLSEASSYGASASTPYGLAPYNYNLENALLNFCPLCTNYGLDITDWQPSVLPQLSYKFFVDYDAYLGLDATGKELYTQIRYHANGVPSVGSIAPSAYLYNQPVIDVLCPGCSGVGGPNGGPSGPLGPNGSPNLDSSDGLKLPAVVVGSVSGLSVGATAGDEVTVVGASSRTKIRNQLYKQFSQSKKGVVLSLLSGDNVISSLDVDNFSANGNCEILQNGTLIYCSGDTVVQNIGSTLYPQATLVVEGGDVYVETNVMGSDRDAFGIVVFEDVAGVGGNLYIDNEVTDLVSVNVYTDGAVLSYDDDALSPVPWTTLASRLNYLKSQLYWSGSVVSANTIGGGAVTTTAAPYGLLANGAPAPTRLEAIENDLNNLREFQVCWYAVSADPNNLGQPAYPVVPFDFDGDGLQGFDMGGNPDNTGCPNNSVCPNNSGDLVDCPGYTRSQTLGATFTNNEPVYLQYTKPPSGLPLLSGVR